VSGAFDPYHRWLGISPKDQPANHYRLLGIDLFEPDPEVVREAAERQMAHVRTYQLGSLAELSQRILNELGAAKACLLAPERKAAYDAALRLRTQPSPTSVPPLVAPIAVPPLPAAKPPELSRSSRTVDSLDEARAPRRLAKLAVRHRKWLLFAGGAAAATLLLIGLGVLLVGPRESAALPKAEMVGFRETELRSGIMRDLDPSPKIGSPSPQPLRPVQPIRPAPIVGKTQKNAEVIVAQPRKAPVTQPPKLAHISDRTVSQGMSLLLRAEIMDQGTFGGRLQFSLAPGAPNAAQIDAHTGVFTWTPTTAQITGVYPITVRVVADGAGDTDDETTFRITVQKLFKPPMMRPICLRAVTAGGRIRFNVELVDPIGQSDKITYSLPQAPPWVSIDSTTGLITCEPGPMQAQGDYSVTVRASNDEREGLQDEKTCMIAVTNPTGMPSRSRHKSYTYPEPAARHFKISLPSGKVLTSADFNIRHTVEREAAVLVQKCRTGSPDVVGVFQEGSDWEIAAMSNVKGTRLHGPTVFFHPYQMYQTPRPKQYVTYKSGKWDGVLATWSVGGQREFWCNYANGQRHGLCCLFRHDAPAVVLECDRNKVGAVHVIAANRVKKSLTDADQAAADEDAGPLLKEIDRVEQGLKADDHLYRDRVKQGVQMRIGNINQQKRNDFGARSVQRAAEQQRQLDNLRQKSIGR
jgi:hypothetical protein